MAASALPSRLFLCRAQPAVTIGNVGQLAVDLLISTAQLPLVGYLESRHVLPCFGLDAFTGDGGPATALELYLDAARGVLVLQQRAPAVTGCQRRFAEELLDWVRQAGLRKVGASPLWSPCRALTCRRTSCQCGTASTWSVVLSFVHAYVRLH